MDFVALACPKLMVFCSIECYNRQAALALHLEKARMRDARTSAMANSMRAMYRVITRMASITSLIIPTLEMSTPSHARMVHGEIRTLVPASVASKVSDHAVLDETHFLLVANTGLPLDRRSKKTAPLP